MSKPFEKKEYIITGAELAAIIGIMCQVPMIQSVIRAIYETVRGREVEYTKGGWRLTQKGQKPGKVPKVQSTGKKNREQGKKVPQA